MRVKVTAQLRGIDTRIHMPAIGVEGDVIDSHTQTDGTKFYVVRFALPYKTCNDTVAMLLPYGPDATEIYLKPTEVEILQ